MSKKLFEDAIADAKRVREAALVNAKIALEEAITPKLQSMIATKLQEMEDDTLDESQDELDEEIDISEALEELDEVEDDSETDDTSEDDFDDLDTEDDSENEEGEDIKISDLSVDEFKELIRGVVAQEMNGGEEHIESEDDMSMDDNMEMGDDSEDSTTDTNDNDDIDLDELLGELDSLNEDEELDEIKLKSAKTMAKGGNAAKGTVSVGYKQVGKLTENYNAAIKTIQKLRKELNEVNLLNNKLIFVNRIFKSKNLNESQKLKVIEKFDNATTTKQAKATYNSLIESLNKSQKQPIKEHLGFASKAVGVAKKQPIVENAAIERMKKLAGLK